MKKIKSNVTISNILLGKCALIDSQVLKTSSNKTYNNLWNSQVNRVAPIKQVGYNINLCVEKKIFSYGKNK